MPPKAAARADTKAKSKLKLDSTQGKSYLTWHVETSIALLESPEDDIVAEALIYLSRYADIQMNNLIYLYQCDLLPKLLHLLDRNVCILRLALRLIGILLNIEEVLVEMDQETYDEQILKISKMYISHNDSFVRYFCTLTLSKLAKSCRITCLIFEIDLFKPILDTIQNTTDMLLLEWTLDLFLKLLSAPSALAILPEIYNFDMSILLANIENTENEIVRLSFEIIDTLTHYCLEPFQKMFREAKLIENMFEVIMEKNKCDYHRIALDIVCSSMRSEETSNYFIESLEFLKFCQWMINCGEEYEFPCISILEQLTRLSSKKQILFDLSVEDAILSFLKSRDKKVLNKACEAISNMSTHKYCCEKMLTPPVLKDLFYILIRKDEEDPGNEVALKTILDLSRGNVKTFDMIHNQGLYKVLLGYMKKGIGLISEESFIGVLEMLYKMSVNPVHQQDLISTSFFEKLLQLIQKTPADTATLICEILYNFIGSADFRRVFLSASGPQICLNMLKTSEYMNLLKNILLFIYSSLVYDNMVQGFVENDLVAVLKGLSEYVKSRMPIMEKILIRVYSLHLPMKLFDTKKLENTDKLENKFYLIYGRWKESFPSFEDLETRSLSTAYAVYVVDYSSEVIKTGEEQSNSESFNNTARRASSSARSMSTLSRASSNISSYFRRCAVHINYGKLSPDPFLPRYIFHVSKYTEKAETMEDKIKYLATYIDFIFCEAREDETMLEKIHNFKLHLEMLKHKLGTNLIPIGFLRLGCHCERALLFKAIADKCCIPTTLVGGKNQLYWNEVLLLNNTDPKSHTFKEYVVDLMYDIGKLLPVGSRVANQYCNSKD